MKLVMQSFLKRFCFQLYTKTDFSGQNLVKTLQKPVTTIRTIIDKINGLSELACDTAYGVINGYFLASDSAGTNASNVGENVSSFL